MRSPSEPVKGRTAAGRRREQRAHATRVRIVKAATSLFLERGYASTTVEAIASSAMVGVATVYQAFGTKAGVLAKALDAAIAGDDEPVAILERDWVVAARAETDAPRRLSAVVRGAAGVAARTAPLKEVMRDAAATEPAIRSLLDEDEARRMVTQRELVAIAVGRRPTEDEVATFYALLNSHSYRLAAARLGWDESRWRRWLVEVMTRQFLVDRA